MNYHLLIIWDDVEPELRGPFEDRDTRDQAAVDFREAEGPEHGLYRVNMNHGKIEINSYVGNDFFENQGGRYGMPEMSKRD